jgi:hypothetical protein
MSSVLNCFESCWSLLCQLAFLWCRQLLCIVQICQSWWVDWKNVSLSQPAEFVWGCSAFCAWTGNLWLLYVDYLQTDRCLSCSQILWSVGNLEFVSEFVSWGRGCSYIKQSEPMRKMHTANPKRYSQKICQCLDPLMVLIISLGWSKHVMSEQVMMCF